MKRNYLTNQKPTYQHICRTGLHKLSVALCSIFYLLAVGCSSGGNSDSDSGNDATGDTANQTANVTVDETSVATATEENDVVSTEAITDLAEVGQTTDEETPTIPTTNNGESSPVELLMGEIQLAAIDPVFQLNRKLQSGESLTELESNCLSDFDPANGQVLDSIECPAEADGASVYGSDLQIYSTTLISTEACEQFLAAASSNSEQSIDAVSTNSCNLETAELLLPVIWIPLENSPPSQIATVMPLQGAAISYNRDGNGRILLQSVSDLFVPYSCEIDLLTMALTDEALAAGDCRQQVDRLIGRLFSLRTGT